MAEKQSRGSRDLSAASTSSSSSSGTSTATSDPAGSVAQVAPRTYAGKPAWTAEEDAVLIETHDERVAQVQAAQRECRGKLNLTATDWAEIGKEINRKGVTRRTPAASRMRYKSLAEANKASTKELLRPTRTRKSSIDDPYVYSDDEEEETPPRRRASVHSAPSSSEVEMSSAARSSASAAPSTSDPAVEDSTYSSKRPWTQEELVKLWDLKSGCSDSKTKYHTWTVLEKSFPGRGVSAISAKWGKIKGDFRLGVELQRAIGEAKRARKLSYRDRSIKAELTGPRRLTWKVIQSRLQQHASDSIAKRKDVDTRMTDSYERDAEPSLRSRSPLPSPAMGFSSLSPIDAVPFVQPPMLQSFLPSPPPMMLPQYRPEPHPSYLCSDSTASVLSHTPAPAYPAAYSPAVTPDLMPHPNPFVLPATRPTPALPPTPTPVSKPGGEVYRGRRMSVRLGGRRVERGNRG